MTTAKPRPKRRAAQPQPHQKKDKRLKIPNFNKFRLLIILASVGLIALIALGYICATVLPKASITIKTDSQALTSSTIITLKTAADTKLDAKTGTVPAKAQTTQKTTAQQVAASGSQNNGAKAAGSVSFSAGACSADVPDPVPAGSAITSNNLAFITQATASFSPVISGSKCTFKSSTIAVEAQKPGAAYNIAASTFAVPGRSTVTGTSSAAMAGGTDDIIKIVLQADIDSATQKISAQDTAPIKEELKTGLVTLTQYPIIETFTSAAPETKTSANAGDKADNVTVTQTIKYTMLGVSREDLKKVIAADVNTKIDPKKQSILDYGIDGAVFGVQGQPDGGAVLTMQTDVVAGPDLHIEDLKKQVAGKKAATAKELIKENPGVKEIDVHYSPFWVSSIPKKTSKITITVEKPEAAKTNSSDAPITP